MTVPQIPKWERKPICAESWWTAFSDASQPRRDEFASEVERRAGDRVNRLEKPVSSLAGGFQSKPEPPREPLQLICAEVTCGKRFEAQNQRGLPKYCSQSCNAKAWKARRRSA